MAKSHVIYLFLKVYKNISIKYTEFIFDYRPTLYTCRVLFYFFDVERSLWSNITQNAIK